MKKIAIAVIMSAFAATAMSAPMMAASHAKKKKDAPGMCGTMKYFDKKSKSCKSKG